MTLSRYNSVRRALGATLLLAGMSLVINPQVRAQEPASVSKESEPLKRSTPSTDGPNEGLLTVVATSMGTVSLMSGSYFIPTLICFINGDLSTYDDCGTAPIYLGAGLLGGIAGGYLGYKNNRPVVTLGGALTGIGVGMILWIPSNTDELLIPIMLLSGGAGGYLGHRLWKVREASGSRYSLSPYWDQERSGFMVSGRF